MGYNRNVPADSSTDRHSQLHCQKENVKKREAAMSLLDPSSLLEEDVDRTTVIQTGDKDFRTTD